VISFIEDITLVSLLIKQPGGWGSLDKVRVDGMRGIRHAGYFLDHELIDGLTASRHLEEIALSKEELKELMKDFLEERLLRIFCRKVKLQI